MNSLVDLRPLRENVAFRRLWLGSTASGFGGQMGNFAVIYFVWQSTHNAAMVGLVGLAAGVPMIVLGLAGSAFLDHVDRRLLAIRLTYARIAVGVLMTAVAFTGTGGVPAMLLLTAAASCCGALAAPAKRTFIPRLLQGDRLAAGLALNHLSFQLAMLLGPALAGLLTAATSVGWCLAIDTVTFGASIVGLAGLPRGVTPADGSPGLSAVRNGLRYAVSTPAVRGSLLADLAATLLAMPVALFPVLNAEKFGDRPEILGLFTTALAVGGVLASILSGTITRRPRAGVVMLICGAVWAASLGLTGLATALPAVLGLIALAGAADTWAVVSRGTVVQTATPQAYLGRISVLENIVGVAGPELGNLRAGLVASATSGGASLVIGGATALVATGLIAVTTPALRRFRSSTTGSPVT
ncbi:MFS transporter [Winogradskya humida]|uniref:MFS transporter n=1 Tax=Winogradskya humida TaxID=113566 RepID=A0ABQ3ZIW5_9ACTN|nr:MFS transporter [Actinoplanes humidus]GIE18529.1 MFS transporter [Actinoplanes humidus]